MFLIVTIKSKLFPLDYIDLLPENKVAGNRPFTRVFSPHIDLSTSTCWRCTALSNRFSTVFFLRSLPINHLIPVALSMIYTLMIPWYLSPASTFPLNTKLRYPTAYSTSSLGCDLNLKCTKQNSWSRNLALTCSAFSLFCLCKWFH